GAGEHASLRRAATAVVTRATTRMETLRRNRAKPAEAEARRPATLGARDTPWRRAERMMTLTYQTAAAPWASTVAQAEPAMPQSRTSTKIAHSIALPT